MTTSLQDEKQKSSRSLRNSAILQGDRDPQNIHAVFNEIPLATEFSLAAALAQLISLACICVAVSLVKWILLLPSKSAKMTGIRPSASYVLGVPYKLEVVDLENITTEELVINSSGVTGDTVLTLMSTACVMSMIFGFVAFLLDFMELNNLDHYRLTLATSLHILSGLFLVTLISICWWWFLTIDRWLLKKDTQKFHLKIIMAESFYLCLVSLIFLVIAVVLSSQAMALREEVTDQDTAVMEMEILPE